MSEENSEAPDILNVEIESQDKSGARVAEFKAPETEEERELREKRERLLEIKRKLAERGGNFGVAIINAGHSYNRYSTLPYSELRAIQKKENRFRRHLGLKKNRKPINNLSNRFVPEVDPRIVRAALKQKAAYHGEGKLNMMEIVGTNTLKEKLIDQAELEGREVPKEELQKFETESILRMQEKAKLALKTAVGNPKLAQAGVPNVPLQECTFQPEQRVVRYGTDTAGDAEKFKFMEEHKNFEGQADLMKRHKLVVLRKKKVLQDKSEKIFEDHGYKKGKEREQFLRRQTVAAKSPEKLVDKKPQKAYQVKDYYEKQTRDTKAARAEMGLDKFEEYQRPLFVPENFYASKEKQAQEEHQRKLAQDDNLQAHAKSVAALDKQTKKDLKKERYHGDSVQVNEFGFKVNKVPMLKKSQSQSGFGQNRDLGGAATMISRAERAWNKAIKADQMLNKREERYNPQKAKVATNLVAIDGSALTADTSPDKAAEAEKKKETKVHRGRPASAKGPVAAPKEKKRMPRPSSAKWADLQSVRGTHGREKLVVHQVAKVHGRGGVPKPPAKEEAHPISHIGQLKSLNQYLERKKKIEGAHSGPRLKQIYGVDNAMIKLYTEIENARRASDKREADLVKTFKEMELGAEDMLQYTKLDHFNSKQHLKDLDLNKARYRWCGPDTYTANDKAEENLKMLFKEPDRLPRYD